MNNQSSINTSKWKGNISPEQIINRTNIKNIFPKNTFTLINGNSSYGTVFKAKSSAIQKFVQNLRTPYYKYFPEWNNLGTTISQAVIKVIHKPNHLQWDRFVGIVEREANIQSYVYRKVPGLTAACLYSAIDIESGIGIIISEFLKITPLIKVKQTNKSMYQKIETCFRSIWNIGIVHMDAHGKNVFVASPDKRLVLLDWGASVFLPKPTQSIMKELLLKHKNKRTPLFEVWDEFREKVKGKGYENIENIIYIDMLLFAGVSPRHRKQNADWLMLEYYYTYYVRNNNLSSSSNNNTVLGKMLKRLALRVQRNYHEKSKWSRPESS
jgi:hypothetical protein